MDDLTNFQSGLSLDFKLASQDIAPRAVCQVQRFVETKAKVRLVSNPLL